MQRALKVKEKVKMDTAMAGVGRQFVKMSNEIEQLLTDRAMMIGKIKELEEKLKATEKKKAPKKEPRKGN